MKNWKLKWLSLLLATAMILNLTGVSTYAAAATDVALAEQVVDEANEASLVDNEVSTDSEAITDSAKETESLAEECDDVVIAENVEIIDIDIPEIPAELADTTPVFTQEELFAIAAEEYMDEVEIAPSDYVLSEEQIQDKKVLAEHFQDVFSLDNSFADVEGIYEMGETMCLAEDEAEAEQMAKTFGARVKSFSYGVAVFENPKDVSVTKVIAAAASLDTNIPAVWPNYIQEAFADLPTDPYITEGNASYQWMHDYIGSKQAWKSGYKGQGVRVCVIDTGLTEAHIDIKNNVIPGKLFAGGAAGTPHSTDNQSHGSHVAGIIAADDNGKLGCGIAPDAKVSAYAVLGSDGRGNSADTVRAINAAVSEKFDIINMSLGGPAYNEPYDKVCAAAKKAGVAIFAAAGNETMGVKAYPAGYSGCISVGSIDINGSASDFSNRGSWVDISFPGSDIYSLKADDVNAYTSKNGTSMATPAAAGTAAVVLSSNIGNINSKTGAAKVDALLSQMKKGATKSATDGMGAGTTYLPKALSLSESLTAVDPVTPSISVANEAASKTGVYRSFPLKINLSTKKTSNGVAIYYSTDGKAPTYKDGNITNYTGVISSSSGDEIKGSITVSSKKVTVKAIAFDRSSMKVSKPASFNCTSEPYPVSVSVRSKTGVNTFKQGSTIELETTIYPEYSKKSVIEWTVDSKGVSAGIAIKNNKQLVIPSGIEGSYSVTAKAMCDGKAYGSSYTYSFNVVNNGTEKKIETKQKSVTVKVGSSLDLDTLITVDGKAATSGAVCWSVSNKKLGTINGSSKLNGILPGKIKVIGTANDGTGANVSIDATIVQPVTSLALSGSHTVAIGKTSKITATVYPKNATNKKLIWEASSTDITVRNGVVDAKNAKKGTYNVYVSTEDGSIVKRAFEVRVTGDPISAIKLNATEVKLFVPGSPSEYAKSKQLTADIGGIDSTAVTFTSKNPSVATVDSSGNIYAVSEGKTVITCSALDGSSKKATCNVSVSVPVSSVYVRPKYETFYYYVKDGVIRSKGASPVAKGYSISLVARCGNAYGNPTNKSVTWKSSNDKLVTVDSKGNVKALPNAPVDSVVTITATSADGTNKSDSVRVIVTNPAPSTSKVHYKKLVYTLGEDTYSYNTFVAAPDGTSSTTFYTYCLTTASNGVGLETTNWVGYWPVNNSGKSRHDFTITAKMYDGTNKTLKSDNLFFIGDDVYRKITIRR